MTNPSFLLIYHGSELQETLCGRFGRQHPLERLPPRGELDDVGIPHFSQENHEFIMGYSVGLLHRVGIKMQLSLKYPIDASSISVNICIFLYLRLSKEYKRITKQLFFSDEWPPLCKYVFADCVQSVGVSGLNVPNKLSCHDGKT